MIENNSNLTVQTAKIKYEICFKKKKEKRTFNYIIYYDSHVSISEAGSSSSLSKE